MVDPSFPSGGRVIESPPGLPEGWKAMEKMYKSGRYAGKTYIRFEGGPRNRKNLCTVPQAIALNADDLGLDPNAERMKYDQIRAEVEAKKEQERAERGCVSKEQEEKAIDLFEREFGKLEAAVVPQIDGWTYHTKWLELSSQTHVTYYSPEGNSFGTVKKVECSFGIRMMNGEERDVKELIKNARAKFIKEYGSLDPGFNPLRRTSDGASFKEAMAEGQADKVKEAESLATADFEELKAKQEGRRASKRARSLIPTEKDYIECPEFTVTMAESEAVLQEASAPNVLVQSLSGLKALLIKSGFEENIQVLAVFSRGSPSNNVQKVAGFYYRMAGLLEERPLFQWVDLCKEAYKGLKCSDSYIFWSAEQKRWQIGPLKYSALVCNNEDTENLERMEQAWRVLKDDWGSQVGETAPSSAVDSGA